MPVVRLAIFGITGRMGQALLRAVREDGRFELSGAIASASSAKLGFDAAASGEPSGVSITADPMLGLTRASVAADFSSSAALVVHAAACARAGVPLLIGVTGYDASVLEALEQAARQVPVLLAPNTSVGVGVLAKLVEVATLALGPDYDVEIAEAHHRSKRDAPSGTALALGEVVAGARQQRLSDVAIFDRHAGAPRAEGSIGFSVLRAGDIVGEHTVTFAGAGERIDITHRATDRMTFARGALRAAEWLIGRPAGLYRMQDVLRF